MKATVLNNYADADILDVTEVAEAGHWVMTQDPISNEILKTWEPLGPAAPLPGQSWEVTTDRFDIECYARGFPEVGFRSSANNESFLDGKYLPMEMIQMTYPAKYVLNRRQLITNIRGPEGKILWMEEETGQATVFEVQGTTPTFDPFGRHIDNLAVLKRSTVQ
jgi:hypothetical protein